MSTSTALATVEEQSSMTLGDPVKMTNDLLADIVIEGVRKFRHYLPYIHILKERFDLGKRDSTNRLRTPIKGCSSWKDFCEMHLDRTPRAIGKALAGKKPTKDAPQVTDAEFAEYEQKHPHVRQSATNLLAKGLTPTDVVGALVGMDVPEPMAKAAVRIVAGPQPALEVPAGMPVSTPAENSPLYRLKIPHP
jgi:hypothetical protein